jgi:hypothetical protein
MAVKGAWYPGGFNPCVYQVKKPVSKCALSKMQLAALQRGEGFYNRGAGADACECGQIVTKSVGLYYGEGVEGRRHVCVHIIHRVT